MSNTQVTLSRTPAPDPTQGSVARDEESNGFAQDNRFEIVELEERIAPFYCVGGPQIIVTNHNETLVCG